MWAEVISSASCLRRGGATVSKTSFEIQCREMPTVSVIMPVRNGAAFLPAAVESLIRQTMPDWELVVAVQPSTDDTREIIEDYAVRESRIRILPVPAAHGGAAATHALRESRAALIARLDADDVCHPTRLALQAGFLGDNPDVLAVGSRIREIDIEGKAGRIRCYPTAPAEIAECLVYRNTFAHSTVMFRREALLSVGAYRPPFELAEDYDLLLRLSELGPLANLPDALVDYRIHPDQLSSRRKLLLELSAAVASYLALRRRAGVPEQLLRNVDMRGQALAIVDAETSEVRQLGRGAARMRAKLVRALRLMGHIERNSAFQKVGRLLFQSVKLQDWRAVRTTLGVASGIALGLGQAR